MRSVLPYSMKTPCLWALFLIQGVIAGFLTAAEPPKLRLLFLGDRGHHQPATRFKDLQPVMAQRGIELVYTENVGDLNAETLGKYDGLVLYANIDEIKDDQAKALLDYVAGGRGFVPLHCASFCFRNNDEVVALMGGQFLRHETGTFRVKPTDEGTKHPLLQGYKSFESWDETYVHTKHNEKDRTVLEYREERGRKEPWTWVRTHGKGRVFYTAWGHDERTWGSPGFQNLVERGIRWACSQDVSVVPPYVDRPEMTPLAKDARPFEYVEANVPYYPPGKAWGTIEAGKRMMQLPLSPEESMKHISVPVGFEVRLFASEPDLQGKPIAMNWDEAGRLWICETYDYPNELQRTGGRDRIRICEDTNGDGKADKFIVFAEQLSIPSTLTFYCGGAIVQNGRETIYLKDTDGDGKADLRKTLVTGWGMGDTHGGVSNFQYGLDNWYYAMQGYNQSAPVLTDGTQVQTFRQGFFRFKVAGENEKTAVTEIEFLRSTNNNTWGLGISEEGLIFGSTANGNPSEFMPIPNRYYESVRGWSSSVLNGIADDNHFEPITDKVRQVDHHGGFTAAAGHALYTARNYPREYWNRTAFVCEPTGHLVATFVIRPDGAGFKSKNSWNLFASNDEWTAPIMAEVGPDGNVWVLDWYNYIVQHNPTPAGFRTGRGAAYESELRDKKHGRIYIVGPPAVGRGSPDPAPGSAAWKPTPLTNAAPDQLIAALKSDNMFWRRHAQRLLVEQKNADVASALTAIIASDKVDPMGLNTSVIHALWVLQSLGSFEKGGPVVEQVGAQVLFHESAGVVRNAIQALPHSPTKAQVLLTSPSLTENKADDRGLWLEALLAVADTPASKESAGALAELFAVTRPELQEDPLLLDAATAAAARSGRGFFVGLANRKVEIKGPRALQRISVVAEHMARQTPDEVLPLIEVLPRMFAPVTEATLEGLVRGWPKDKPAALSDDENKALLAMFEKGTPATRSRLVTLANRWGNKELEAHAAEIAKSFITTVEDESKSDKERAEAATQLITFRKTDTDAVNSLLEQITPRTSPELATALVDAVRQSESSEAGTAIVEKLGVFLPAVKQSAIKTLLTRREWTSGLLDAIEKGTVLPGELSLDQKQALATHPSREISARAKTLLAKSGGLPSADRQKVLDELLPLTKKKGDAAAGKLVFTKTCAKCHTHSGEGTKVGPDLTGMAVHPKAELLTQIIDPSRSVEGNFRVYTIATADGLVMNGLLASESKTALEIIDTEGKKQTILREDIERLIQSPKSLMPEGFEKQVTPEEITNLLEFLAQRGKYLPLPLEKVATIITTRGMFFDESGQVERLVFDDWKPKVFEGVPFVLVDPQGDKVKNAILLYGPQGTRAPTMPKSVTLPVNGPAKAIHMLSGVSGWGFPIGRKGSVSLIVRLKYEDGQSEDIELKNGEHFADYIRRVDVEGSKFAFQLRGQQIRYLAIEPKRKEPIREIDLVKGPDATAPVVMAVTVEGP